MSTRRPGARAACALLLVSLLVACSGRDAAEPAVAADAVGSTAQVAPPAPPDARFLKESAEAPQRQGAVEDASRRHVAVRHELQLIAEADAVESAWQRAQAACAEARCELLASQLVRDDAQQPAQAMLEARVPPDRVEALLQAVSALGVVGRHARQAVDRTDLVIDTDARLKNLAEFRDQLRRLLATPNARLKDLVEVERELVRVQSELDGLATRRQALAAETEKVHVLLSITPRPAVLAQGLWAPVRHTVLNAGHVFARSLAAVIEGAVAVVPWAVLLLGVGLAIRRAAKKKAVSRSITA